MLAERVELVGRVAHHELADRVAVEPATSDVATGVPRVVGLQQPVVVEVDRCPHGLGQAGLALPVARMRRVVVAECDVGLRRESLDGTDEVEVLDLAHERDRVPALLATEAMKQAHARVDGEGR